MVSHSAFLIVVACLIFRSVAHAEMAPEEFPPTPPLDAGGDD